MKLYNQTNKPLRWDISMTTYTADPYGEVIVPDMYVEHCKARQLPLDVTPVAPEIKANKSLEEVSDTAKRDALVAVQKQLSEAVAAENVAKSELVKSIEKVTELSKTISGLELTLSQSESKYKILIADHSALNELFEKQTKDFEVCKQERDRAVATVSEFSKAAQSVKEEKPAKK